MTSPTPQDWFRPRLQTLVADAARAGYALDVSVAIITDIINEAPFNVGPLDTQEDWNRDIGQPADLSADLTGAGGLAVEEPLHGEMREISPQIRRQDR
jgi:hypothetical protein